MAIADANVFKLLVIFRDTTNGPHCQKHLAVALATGNQTVNLESIAPHSGMYLRATSKYVMVM